MTDEHFTDMKKKLKSTSDYAFEKLSKVRGLTPIKAKGAMYMMIKIELNEFTDIKDDLDFAVKLLHEA